MAEIRVPTLGESVTEATIGKWFKKAGDMVAVDEPLVELETDKVTIEVPAPAAGVLTDVAVKDGDTVAVGALLGAIKEGPGAAPAKPQAKPAEAAPRLAPQPAPAKPAAAPAPEGSLAPSVRKIAARNRHGSLSRTRHRQGRPRPKGDMLAAIERAAAQTDACRYARLPPSMSAPLRRPMTPRARSECA
jgi:2-oxoglutarate dehydrogenase E2 component (dihydrolipoamide succinyltransferase)